MNTETGQLYLDPTSEELKNPAVVQVTTAQYSILEKVPEADRPRVLDILRSIGKFDLDENEANVLEALKKERARIDATLGLHEDDPEDFKRAVRNMGPVTRKLFMKRVKNGKMTDERLQEYISHYAPKEVV